jgi:RNAse (barnase) inhibitor barstar
MWNDLFVPGGEDFVWLRRELPWLDTGFLPRLPSGQLGRTLEDLDRLGFKVYHLEGERIRSAEECYAEVTRTFGFWDNWEGNADAFHDFFTDVEFPRRAAIVWSSTRALATADPVTFARTVGLLILERDRTSADACQLEIFLGE